MEENEPKVSIELEHDEAVLLYMLLIEIENPKFKPMPLHEEARIMLAHIIEQAQKAAMGTVVSQE